jgi:hypothetical protein
VLFSASILPDPSIDLSRPPGMITNSRKFAVIAPTRGSIRAGRSHERAQRTAEGVAAGRQPARPKFARWSGDLAAAREAILDRYWSGVGGRTVVLIN